MIRFLDFGSAEIWTATPTYRGVKPVSNIFKNGFIALFDMSEFSIRVMKDILNSQGNKRVSKGAAEELRSILETFAGDVAEESIAQAHEADRKTVKEKDVRKAIE